MGTKKRLFNIISIFVGASMFIVMACEEEAQESPGAAVSKAASTADHANLQGAAEADKDGDADKSKVALTQLKETDFIKGPKRRDPFEPFVELLTKQEEVRRLIQREVKLKEYDISELQLIGIITNIGDPRAMVTVPNGTGFVLKRGDYVGKADFIKQGTQGEPIQVNWRVSRIHGSGKEEERGVYLVRDDPTTTKGVDITRFLPLHGSQY
jgi:type IV pilus assembly protein PilP